MQAAHRITASTLMVLVALALLCAPAWANKVRYPQGQGDDNFELGLLKVALERAKSDYVVELVPKVMQQSRIIAEIGRQGGSIDIIATMTSREREAALLPIRIPLDKGLFGWRIAFVSAERSDLLSSMHTPADLGRVRAGQGHDWPDLEIMRANGLTVRGVSDRVNLFKMLELGRIDYFPRSMLELQREAATHPTLRVDQHILLRYPAAYYFFVNKANAKLAVDIERGLEAMIADGSFDKMFYQFYGPTLRNANLTKRRVLNLENPNLPEATPLARKELWFRPDDPKTRRILR